MIRLVIVDDHKLMRQLLVEELDSIEEFTVIADVESGEEALNILRHVHADVVLMDISLPGKDGIETTAELRNKGIIIPVLCLTMHLNTHVMERAMKAGVSGYALKHDAFDDLVSAIHAVNRGDPYVSPALAPGETTGVKPSIPEELPAVPELSVRECEILARIAAGMTSKQIAEALDISPRTVDFHRRNIARKTGFKRVADLTQFALKTGLATGS